MYKFINVKIKILQLYIWLFINCLFDFRTEEFTNVSAKTSNVSPVKQTRGREEGWKEVVRTRYLASPYRSKKVSVPLNAISRVIGRGGSNINAIRASTGALIEVDNQSKGQGERIITIK